MKDIDIEMKLIKRGVFEIISEQELKEKLIKSYKNNKPLIVKLGIDPTAPDVHLGFAVVLRKLRQFQDLGHKVVIVIGDFTAQIGDPTGKSKTRKMLTSQEVKENAKTYLAQFSKILDKEKTEIVFNSKWLSDINLEQLIKLMSKFTVAQILERDDFMKRYKSGRPIGLHEFLYPILQAQDSVYLNADIEIGGSDQKFNFILTRHLQKEFGQEPEVIILMPILEGLDGKEKMSKSLGNYVGINEDPVVMYGKIMSIPDELIIKYFYLTTYISEDKIKDYEKQMKEGKNPRDYKMLLAREIVKIYHGKEMSEYAENEFKKVFQKKDIPDNIKEVKLQEDLIKEGKVWIIKLLTKNNLAQSSREARRLVSQGSVYVNKEKINDVNYEISLNEFKKGVIVKVGKRKFLKICK